MKAQILYNLREDTGFCGGTTLHGFFMQQLGEPSPGGETVIDDRAACQFVRESFDHMALHNPNMARWCWDTAQKFKKAHLPT